MNFFAAVRIVQFILNPPKLTIQELATGLCALPMPKQRIEAPKKAKAADLFVINEERNEFGFNFASSTRQDVGGVSDLTGYDVRLLKERGYWGKGKDVQSKNAACKSAWHGGRSEAECAVSLGVSESWVEKRYGTFATALLEEEGQG